MRGRSKFIGSIDSLFWGKGKENKEEDEALSSSEEEEENKGDKFNIDDLLLNGLESSAKSGLLLHMSAAEEVIQSTLATLYEERVGREKAIENERNTGSSEDELSGIEFRHDGKYLFSFQLHCSSHCSHACKTEEPTYIPNVK